MIEYVCFHRSITSFNSNRPNFVVASTKLCQASRRAWVWLYFWWVSHHWCWFCCKIRFQASPCSFLIDWANIPMPHVFEFSLQFFTIFQGTYKERPRDGLCFNQIRCVRLERELTVCIWTNEAIRYQDKINICRTC